MYIDLHCDTITTLNQKKASLYENDLMVSLKKGKALDQWLQTYAIFIPDTYRGQAAVDYYEDNLRYFYQQMEENKEHVLQINRFSDIDTALSSGRAGGILAIEGGAAIGGDLKKIEKIAKDGVKFLTLTWNGKNEIASGNVTEEGMSDFGREAVAEATALEAECDAQFNALLRELRAALAANGLDQSLASSVRQYYASEKSLLKAQYLSKYKEYLS